MCVPMITDLYNQACPELVANLTLENTRPLTTSLCHSPNLIYLPSCPAEHCPFLVLDVPRYSMSSYKSCLMGQHNPRSVFSAGPETKCPAHTGQRNLPQSPNCVGGKAGNSTASFYLVDTGSHSRLVCLQAPASRNTLLNVRH